MDTITLLIEPYSWDRHYVTVDGILLGAVFSKEELSSLFFAMLYSNGETTDFDIQTAKTYGSCEKSEIVNLFKSAEERVSTVFANM